MEASDAFPDFNLKNQDNEDINFYRALEGTKKGVILFVYPKANTPGCTKQACGFRDNYEKILKYGYEVFGISKDKPTQQLNWKSKQKLPYNLLCEGDEVLKSLGCLNGSSVTRSVFVIDKTSCKFILNKIKIGPEPSVAAVLEVIQRNSILDESDGEESEEELKKPEQEAESKPKTKSSGRGRPPLEIKSAKKEKSEEKKGTLKRGVSKKEAPTSQSPIGKKRARAESLSRPTRSASTTKTGNSKRGEINGLEKNGTSKGVKRQRKDSESDLGSTKKARSASQPVTQRSNKGVKELSVSDQKKKPSKESIEETKEAKAPTKKKTTRSETTAKKTRKATK